MIAPILEKNKTEQNVSKWVQLVNILQDRIIANQWPAGTRIPSYEELLKEFQVSRVTMQQAIGRLKDDGYLVSKERQGLFVSKSLPHINRIGFVLPHVEKESNFLMTLINSAMDIAGGLGKEFEVYRNIAEPYSTSESRNKLIYDINSKRLAGLIYLFSLSKECSNPSLYSDNEIPKIVFNDDKLPNSIRFSLDNLSLVTRALDHFEEQGCKRIAFLCQWDNPPTLSFFRDEVKKRGLHSPFEWQITFHNYNVSSADQVTRLLMSLPKDQRPEGIFIGNDQLAMPVVKGIVASRINVPEELQIVSHCNWGEALPDIIPVTYLGFDSNLIIRNSIKVFDDFYHNKEMKEQINVPALFAKEIHKTNGEER